MSQKLRTADILSYALLAMPLAFASMPLYVHAPDYYATQYGLSLSLMGVILLFIRLFDAIQDPAIGFLSDRFNSAKLIIIALSAIVLTLSFAALFQAPRNINPAIWFAITMILATTSFSIISINLQTIGGLWSRDKNNKVKISAYREAFGLAGLLTAVILPAILMQNYSAGTAFLIVSMILTVIMVIAVSIFSLWFGRHTPEQHTIKTGEPTPVSANNRLLYVTYFVSMLASAIPAILVLFFIRDRLQSENETGLYLALYFISGACGMPLWQYLSKRMSKEFAWMVGMLLAVISFIWAAFLTPETAWQYTIICITSGMALGSDLAIPPAILADNIHDTNNEKEAGSQYSILTFLAKAALAIASAITLPLLDFAGYTPGAQNNTSALVTLSITYAAIPCFIKCIAIALLWKRQNPGDVNVKNSDRPRTGHSHHSRSDSNV